MREKLKAKRELSKKHIDKKLMRRLLIHFGISVIMLGVMIYEMIISSIERRRPAIAIAMGFAIGSVTHRIFLIYRHEDEQKVLSRIDRTG